MSCSLVSFFCRLGITVWLVLGMLLAGGAEQTGTTVLIRTAGAMKLGLGLPNSVLSSVGVAKYEGFPALILGGAGNLVGKLCGLDGLDPSEEVGLTVLISTGSAADGGLRHLGGLILGGFCNRKSIGRKLESMVPGLPHSDCAVWFPSSLRLSILLPNSTSFCLPSRTCSWILSSVVLFPRPKGTGTTDGEYSGDSSDFSSCIS